MSLEFEQLLVETPVTIAFRDFAAPEDIDLRRGCVDVLFANTIGINVASADWLPNNDPPDLNERLAWIWFVRPDFANKFVELTHGHLRLLIECYRDSRMNDWWATMTAD